jgi:cyclic pyranopterin phosphate synthase
MVGVSHKPETSRTAVAVGRVSLGAEAFVLVRDNRVAKGDVLTVAQIAGIQAAKQTAQLIPLCHTLLLSKVELDFSLEEATHSIRIRSKVECVGRTGVEIEAIMAVSVAACTIYDMCKAISKDIVISSIYLDSKSGGKSGDYKRAASVEQ